jgi:hypothetical protein
MPFNMVILLELFNCGENHKITVYGNEKSNAER